MRFYKRKIAALLLSAVMVVTISACGGGKDSTANEQIARIQSELDTDEMFTDRDKEVGYDSNTAVTVSLNGSTASCDSQNVTISGGTVTLTAEGEYLFSGTLQGQIVVDATNTEKLHLVLDGVEISCDGGAAIYVKQADKVFITLASGSTNTLTSTGTFTADGDTNVDAVIFSKDDLTLNGSGTLTINSENGHGVVSKDDLVITSGTYIVTASGHALSGKDSVRIAGGNLKLTAGKDGIHTENNDDSSLGFLYIADGQFDITGNGDGMDASAYLLLEGGSIHISSTDDALHASGDLYVTGGSLTLSTGDDGMHADAGVTVDGGTINIVKSYEGVEGQTIDITGGEIAIRASDDGLNAAGGNDQSGFAGGMRRDAFAADDNVYINITGGKLTVNASGDGIDSNGNLYVAGGEIYVSGPTDNGNGALDYNGEAQITGGTLVAVGSSGMAQNFGSGSTQGSILLTVSSQSAGSTVQLTDRAGTVLVSYTPEKAYNCVVISCPSITQDATYTLTAGQSQTTVEMTGLIYGASGGMGGMGTPGGGMGAQGGGFGGGSGGRPGMR